MNNRGTTPTPPRSRRRKLFVAACLLAPLVLLLAAELIVRAVWRRDDPFLGIDRPTSLFTEVTIDGKRWYQITHHESYRADDLRFPVEKPNGTLRVFCLGESASAGWPHPSHETYSSYLSQALQRAFPSQKVEVLNVGAHAYASYRVRLICDDVLRYGPDLLILWCGNNEFVDERAYVDSAGLGKMVAALARTSRLFALLDAKLRAAIAPENVIKETANESLDLLVWKHTEQLAGRLRTDPKQFAKVQQHYEFSIEHMVGAAERAGVPVLVLTVPVNLRDWRPHVSRQTLQGQELAAWSDGLLRARRALLAGDSAAALASCDELLRSQPEHAEALFWKGTALEALGRRDEALTAFRAAKDNDLNPFRALSVFLDTLVRIAAKHPNATLLDAARLCAEAVGGAPGFDLFLDYVHPSKRGNLLIARHVFETIMAKDLLRTPPAVHDFVVADTGYADEQDASMQITLLSLLSTMHQYEAFLKKLDLFEKLAHDAAIPLPESASALLKRCREEFTSYLDNERKQILGEPFAADYRERHKQFYREFFGALRSLKPSVPEPQKR